VINISQLKADLHSSITCTLASFVFLALSMVDPSLFCPLILCQVICFGWLLEETSSQRVFICLFGLTMKMPNGKSMAVKQEQKY
jgi:hypothetical protein